MVKGHLFKITLLFGLCLFFHSCTQARNNPMDPSASNYINPVIPKFVKAIGGYGSASGQFLNKIEQVYESSYDGSIWVTSSADSTSAAPVLTRFDSNGDNPSQYPNFVLFNSTPYYTYGSSFEIFSNTASGNIVFFGLTYFGYPTNTNFVFLQEISHQTGTNVSIQLLSTNFPALLFAKFQAPDKIWGTASSVIKCYSTNGTLVRTIGSLGSGNGQFNQIFSSVPLISLLGPNYLIAPKDSANDQVFDLSGNFLFSIPGGHSYTGYGHSQQSILKFSKPGQFSPPGYFLPDLKTSAVIPLHPTTGQQNALGWGGGDENITGVSKIFAGSRNSIFLTYSEDSANTYSAYKISIYR